LSDSHVDNLWNQANAELNKGNEAIALQLFKRLSSIGDWSGSFMLGRIYQTRGLNEEYLNDISIANHKKALYWFEKSLAQNEQYFSHYAIAQYYYFGWGGKADYTLAYEHLIQCVSDDLFDVEDNELKEGPFIYIMLGELLRLGKGCEKDVEKSKKYFKKVASLGYPVGFLGLKMLAKQEKKYFMAFIYYFLGIAVGLKVIFGSGDKDKLSGVSKEPGDFRFRLGK
jgi:TPR repeat protein